MAASAAAERHDRRDSGTIGVSRMQQHVPQQARKRAATYAPRNMRTKSRRRCVGEVGWRVHGFGAPNNGHHTPATFMFRAGASVAALFLACCGTCCCIRLAPMRPHALPLLVAATRPRVPPVLLEPSAVGPLLTASAVAAVALQDSAVGRAVSPPMLSFAFALGLSNAGLLPTAHPLYVAVSSQVLPLAVALSLISATGGALEPAAAAGSAPPGPSPLRPTLIAFALGAFGTLVGSLVAYYVCSPRLLAQPAAATAAGLMCATCLFM